MTILPLNQMEKGENGLIVEIKGGISFFSRLESMNIRVGKRITKLSAMFRRGPITIRLDNTQLALGFGMANKILVEVHER